MSFASANFKMPHMAKPPTLTASDAILRVKSLTKVFGGLRAVDGVDLNIQRGSIHAVIGPNGAGKTTCFNLLTKFLEPSSGSIVFNGHDITHAAPSQVARMGLVRSFQISAIFPNLTLLENVRVALQRSRGRSFDFWRSENALRPFDAQARALIDGVGLAEFTSRRAAELSYGRKRALEIATTLALEPDMMLLDEPTAGMAQQDIERIIQLIRQHAKGKTILMVEHNLSVVATLCHSITVLVRGKILAEGNYAAISKNPSVVDAYIGASHE